MTEYHINHPPNIDSKIKINRPPMLHRALKLGFIRNIPLPTPSSFVKNLQANIEQVHEISGNQE
jgi:hypothetical protein